MHPTIAGVKSLDEPDMAIVLDYGPVEHRGSTGWTNGLARRHALLAAAWADAVLIRAPTLELWNIANESESFVVVSRNKMQRMCARRLAFGTCA